jgi:hypothetical protein
MRVGLAVSLHDQVRRCGTDLLPLRYIFGYRGKEVVR